MSHKHQLTYVDMHPQAIQPERRYWLHVIAAVVLFAAIGAMLAY